MIVCACVWGGKRERIHMCGCMYASVCVCVCVCACVCVRVFHVCACTYLHAQIHTHSRYSILHFLSQTEKLTVIMNPIPRSSTGQWIGK